jgi:hypothetical protein
MRYELINGKATGGAVPIGPPADIAAKLAALKEEMRKQGTDFNRRQQGIANMEKMAGKGVSLPTDKAKGGSVMGINVATDRKAGLSYADLIVDGHKTYESRNSDTLRPYVGKRVAIVRTGKGHAKAIGEVTIGEPEVVNKRRFRELEGHHMVPEGSQFDINTETKHLYPLHKAERYEQERDVGHGIISRKVIHKDKGGKVEVRPTVFDDAASRRNPKIEAAARSLVEGKMKQAAYAKVVAKEKPVKAYDFIPKPATNEKAMEVLLDRQKQNWRSHEGWPAGHRVGLRLDIPAYERHGVWVNSVHDESGGQNKLPTSYGPVSSVRNAEFHGNPHKGIKVATGEQSKAPFAKIMGELEHIDEDKAVKHMQKYLKHPDYRQVGYDPRRHGDFYDRETMEPVTHSEHVVQIGPLVLAKKPKYGKRELYKKGGEVKPFDYENTEHTYKVAHHLSKHPDFKIAPDLDAKQILHEMMATGNHKFIEDPRSQEAIHKAGHREYYVQEKTGKVKYPVQHVVKKAFGGSINEMKAEMMGRKPASLSDLTGIGANEAPNMNVKAYVPPTNQEQLPVGGVSTSTGSLPVGGVDMNSQQQGQQFAPQAGAPQQPPPQGGLPPQGQPSPLSAGASSPSQQSNILQMTPQGQALSAMKPPAPAQPMPKMADGGSAKSTAQMKAEMAVKAPADTGKRVTINAEGAGGVKGIVVPRHTLEGNKKAGAVGLHEMNEARAQVYGDDHREPLSLGKMAAMHKKTLEDHFAKPIDEQQKEEAAALGRLRDAKHINKTANTLDESEKLDTVRHETDDEGRTHVGFASKGVAGHALYTSGSGDDTKYHVINTCAGQTEGCGGGKDAQGIVDTKRGTCFAPNAESQYAGAAVRRAAHEQAKHDPAMTNDWILAHTGSLRDAARLADKGNKRLLFRPNVVDETDVTSRHAIRHLNDQRKTEGKPPIIANSYGKTNELHDPENGYYVTHSNVGPKVKKGESIAENIGRDKARVRNTIMAADNKGDFRNEQGNKTPPKGSYMVTDVKRGSPMAKKMEAHITHAKYWTTGRKDDELSPAEKEEGAEGHFGGNGKPTSPDKAHFGHITLGGKRFDYQKQHILHPRLVQVGENKDGTPHMIPTDSRFKDEEFLPKNRFKTKNGKNAGHILMTTPTESTSLVGHQTSFTHNVNDRHIEHAQNNKGEYEIDKPEDQIKAEGKEYKAPQPIKFYAEGGTVDGRHVGFSHDDFHAFPEQNVIAQRHLSMRRGEDEKEDHGKRKKPVSLDTMRFELTMKKAK